MIFRRFVPFFLFISLLVSTVFVSAQSDSITIVSWNVFQRPDILNDHQKKRIYPIADALLQTKADFLCLQELFHKRSRKRLIKALKEEYPYYKKGPDNQDKFFKTNSGLIIFSKTPQKKGRALVFKEASKADAIASKGVVGLYLEGYNLWLFNTHMQSGRSLENQAIRDLQYSQIKNELLSQISEPYFFCGDFNTRFSVAKNMSKLRNRLAVKIPNKINSELKFSSNFVDNGMYKTTNDALPEWIDFIFLSKDLDYNCTNFEISRPQKKWSKKTPFLSDHAMIKGLYTIK